MTTVASVADLAAWARAAIAGNRCVYHMGSLARDRRASETVNALADTALLLFETRYLRLQQRRLPLSIEDEDRWCYLAIRATAGYAPRAIIALRITSFEWRALRALRDRDADISATRAVRDALGYSSPASFDVARSMLELLRERELICPAPGKGWALSSAGLEALT